MDVKNIVEASVEEINEFLNSIDTVLLDCDGVLWHLHDVIPGAKECLAALKGQNKKLRFVTNNSVRSVKSYQEMFNQLGIHLDECDLIQPVTSIIKYLKDIKFDGLIYCIATSNFKEQLKAAGFKLIDDPMDLVPESFTKMIRAIRKPEPVQAVIVDMDFNNSHTKVARAAYFLSDPGVHFIAGASDLYLPLPENVSILGPGYFTEIIEQHTKRKPVKLSKPGNDLAERIVAETGKRCLFIGDMIEQDMGFADKCGFKKLLVLSGGTSKADLNNLPKNSTLKPNFYGNSLNDLYLAVQKLNDSKITG